MRSIEQQNGGRSMHNNLFQSNEENKSAFFSKRKIEMNSFPNRHVSRTIVIKRKKISGRTAAARTCELNGKVRICIGGVGFLPTALS